MNKPLRKWVVVFPRVKIAIGYPEQLIVNAQDEQAAELLAEQIVRMQILQRLTPPESRPQERS